MASPSKNRRAIVTHAIFGALLAAISVTSAAEASPPVLDAPEIEGCPSAEVLRRRIVEQIGRDDFDRADAPSVVVRVRRGDGTVVADVSVTSHTGATATRAIDGATCEDVVRAASLSIALAIERDEVERPAPPSPPVPPERGGPPGVVTTKAQDDRVVVTASGVASLGLVPRPSAGAGVAARVRVSGMAWLSARGLWLPGASMLDESFALRLLAAGGGACVEPFGVDDFAAVGCAHIVAGSFDVTKTSVDFNEKAAKGYLAASLSVGARLRVFGPVHLEGAVDAHVPFIRPTYVTTTCPPTGFEPAFVALGLWLGAGISLH